MEGEVKIDTVRLREDGNDILEMITEVEKKINEYFKNIDNIQNSHVWNGQNAKNYIKLSMQDKPIFIDYVKAIKDIATKMKKMADDTEETIKTEENKAMN